MRKYSIIILSVFLLSACSDKAEEANFNGNDVVLTNKTESVRSDALQTEISNQNVEIVLLKELFVQFNAE